jgi:hypothetical protein
VFLLEHVTGALRLAVLMFWEVLWRLTLGFLLPAGGRPSLPSLSLDGSSESLIWEFTG